MKINRILPLINLRVIQNFFALLIMQGGNYLLPLILIPYLIRVLGLGTFGTWVFAMSFVAFFRTVITYGFDLTATRQVTIRREDATFLGQLYSAVIAIRLSLLLLCNVFFILMSVMFTNIEDIMLLGMLSMLVLLGEVLFPIWLFQGMERMSFITKIKLSFKAAFVIMVMLLVKSPQDVVLIPIIESITSLMAGLVALWAATKYFGISLSIPKLQFTLEQLKDGAAVFFSNSAVHFYTTINTIALGVIAGPIAVAQFAIAEKVYSAIRGLLGPIVQAIFPALAKANAASPVIFRDSARKISIAFVALLLILAVGLFFTSDFIVHLIVGHDDPIATEVLKILSICLCFTLGSFLSSFLIVQKFDKTLLKITTVTAIFNLIIIIPLIQNFGIFGVAWGLLVVQVFHSLLQLYANRKILLPEKMEI